MEGNAQKLFVIHEIQIIVISDKLKKKKFHTLIRKYEDDLCHAQKEGPLSSNEACTAEPRAFNNKAIKRGEGTLETNKTTSKGTTTMSHTGTAYESP